MRAFACLPLLGVVACGEAQAFVTRRAVAWIGGEPTTTERAEASVPAEPVPEPEAEAPAEPPPRYLGLLVAHERVTVVAPTDGVVVELAAELGELLADDAVVARLDATEAEVALRLAQAQVAAARARLDEATVELERASAIASEEKALGETSSKRQRREAALDQRAAAAARAHAVAQLAEHVARRDDAERQLAERTLRAPMIAIASQPRVSPGQHVTAGTPIVELVGRALRVRFAVPTAEGIPALGREVVVHTQHGVHRGRVIGRAAEIDVAAQTLAIEVAVDDEAGALVAGSRVEVEIVRASS